MRLGSVLRLVFLWIPVLSGLSASATEMELAFGGQGSGTLNGVAFIGSFSFVSTFNTDDVSLIGGTPFEQVVQTDSTSFVLLDGTSSPLTLTIPVWFEYDPAGVFVFGGGDVNWLKGRAGSTPYYGQFYLLTDPTLANFSLLNQTSGSYSGSIGGDQRNPGVLPSADNVDGYSGLLALAYPSPLGSEWSLTVAPTPESSTFSLFVFGLIGLRAIRRSRLQSN